MFTCKQIATCQSDVMWVTTSTFLDVRTGGLMAESSTDGKAQGDTSVRTPEVPSEVSTHESGPGEAGATDSDLDILARGSTVGRYLVLERLGAGAMGVVYAAYDPKLDRKIALKLLRPQHGRGDHARRTARLEREAQAIAKLSHPNVIGIFDVGVHEGQVFMAMEYLAGGTLRDWIAAQKRPWREIVKMFIEVGHGLEAAHAAGLIHRDFKPDNVLLDKQGSPKVVDFGLVRLTAALNLTASASLDPETAKDEDSSVSQFDGSMPAGLTRTGALAGTPAYMAPEQFLGKAVDARTDQFAFCVALYEALYGDRPFAGESLLALADSVTAGQIKEARAGTDVPGWLRRAVIHGLTVDPLSRYSGVEELLRVLAVDPVARFRRRSGIAAAVILVVVLGVGVQRRSERHRLDFERQIAQRLDDGRRGISESRRLEGQLAVVRSQAFAMFDRNGREDGERLWNEARGVGNRLDTTLQRAQGSLTAAFDLDPTAGNVRQLLGEVIVDRAVLAESEFRKEDVDRHLRELHRVDSDGAFLKQWTAPGSVSIRTIPVDAHVSIERYDRDRGRQKESLTSVSVGDLGNSPIRNYNLIPASYRIVATKEGRARTVFPLVVKRNQAEAVEIDLPLASEVPEGFTFIPAGRFYYGDADEDWRLSFLNAVPLHERQTPEYLVKTHETTFADWIQFLSELPPRERQARSPASAVVQGAVRLRETPAAGWVLELSASAHRSVTPRGQKVRFLGRPDDSASQDWLKMPAVGMSPGDMRSYLAWLDRTGRVPGARFCKDTEWERAARGADDRNYPGTCCRLDSADANIDATYGRIPGAYGPDEVGRHPRGQSPFGVEDLAGNAWEVVESEGSAASFIMRGGSYYQASMSARSTNREPAEEATRSHLVGLRVCADLVRHGKRESR